jgi:hypothetical protein
MITQALAGLVMGMLLVLLATFLSSENAHSPLG